VVRKRVIVAGDVQGVFFRDTCRRFAIEQSVAGWVRNLPDGTVEAVFEGDAYHVDRLVEWARNGPSQAIVDCITVFDEPAEGCAGFEIRSTPWRR
jgi:acylphosphatase